MVTGGPAISRIRFTCIEWLFMNTRMQRTLFGRLVLATTTLVAFLCLPVCGAVAPPISPDLLAGFLCRLLSGFDDGLVFRCGYQSSSHVLGHGDLEEPHVEPVEPVHFLGEREGSFDGGDELLGVASNAFLGPVAHRKLNFQSQPTTMPGMKFEFLKPAGPGLDLAMMVAAALVTQGIAQEGDLSGPLIENMHQELKMDAHAKAIRNALTGASIKTIVEKPGNPRLPR